MKSHQITVNHQRILSDAEDRGVNPLRAVVEAGDFRDFQQHIGGEDRAILKKHRENLRLMVISGDISHIYIKIIYIYIYIYIYVCMYACMHACMYVCVYVCMYACMDACMHCNVW